MEMPWRAIHGRYIVEHDRFGIGSVIFWDGIFYDGRAELFSVNRGNLIVLDIRFEILDPIGRPFIGSTGDNACLVQDNARPHTAYVVQDYIEQEPMEIIDWPSRCIIHMCYIVYRLVSGSANPPGSVQELEITVLQAWTNVPHIGLEHAELLQRVPRCTPWSYTLLTCAFKAIFGRNAIGLIFRHFRNKRKVSFLKQCLIDEGFNMLLFCISKSLPVKFVYQFLQIK